MTESPSQPITSATVGVPVPAPQPQGKYDEWGVAGIIVAGVCGTLVILNGLIGVTKGIMEFFEKKKSGDRELTAPLETRMQLLEEQAKQYRTSDYLDREFSRLEAKIDHEKGNRQGVVDALSSQFRSIEAKLSEEQQARIRIEAVLENTKANTHRVETAVELLRERIEERFDRFQEILSNANKH